MSANRLFLVCVKHPDIEHALVLAERATSDSQYIGGNFKRSDEWFKKHHTCGGDCFTVAYHRPKDWDQSPPADPVAASVRTEIALAQLNGSDTEH